MSEPSFQAEYYIVRTAPPFFVGDRALQATAFVLERSQDVLLEPTWRTLVDLSRVEALQLEGRLEGVTAVDIVQLSADRPARLVLQSDERLATALERAYWDKNLLLSNGLLNPDVLEAVTSMEHHSLVALAEGHAWA